MDMGLTQSGELLAVTIEKRINSQDGSEYDSKSLTIFDGRDSKRLFVGRDFPTPDLLHLKDRVAERPLVAVDVFVSNKGGLYANRLVGIEPNPAFVGASGK